MRPVFAAALLAFPAVAAAGSDTPPPPRSAVVWALATPPSDDLRRRAERITGPATHAAWADFVLTPQPFGDDDTRAASALDASVNDAHKRWDDFDVEGPLAAELQATVKGIAVVRDDADRSALETALLLEGAATLRLAPESKFETAEAAAPFRQKLVTTSAPSALIDVVALDPDRVWTRADVPDGATLLRLQALQTEVKAAPRGKLQIDPLPTGVLVVVDGRPLAAGTKEVPLEPGHHYVHAMVGGQVAGRQELDVAPGETERFRAFVPNEELTQARTRILALSSQMPEHFGKVAKAAGEKVGPDAPVYLAAVDDKGNPQIVAFANAGAIDRRKPVTVILAGDIGGGVVVSPAFSHTPGESVTAMAFGGNLGFEVGIYNAVIFGGTSLDLTPTEQMKYANDAMTENVETSAYFRPHGGIGVYLPRPSKDKPLLMLGGDYGWMSPGSLGFGARISLGVPVTGDGTWIRFVLDGFRGTEMAGFPDEGQTDWSAALRLGFGRLL